MSLLDCFVAQSLLLMTNCELDFKIRHYEYKCDSLILRAQNPQKIHGDSNPWKNPNIYIYITSEIIHIDYKKHFSLLTKFTKFTLNTQFLKFVL